MKILDKPSTGLELIGLYQTLLKHLELEGYFSLNLTVGYYSPELNTQSVNP